MENSENKKSEIERTSEDLFNFAIDRQDVKWLMERLPPEADVKRSTVEYELQILKIIGVGWSISYYLTNSPQKIALLKLYWNTVNEFSRDLKTTMEYIKCSSQPPATSDNTRKFGSASVAFAQLSFSGICCLLSGLIFQAPPELFLAYLIFWGIVVVGDSPQFSILVAHTAPKELVGSALTIVNCIGFFITIISIQLMTSLIAVIPSNYLYTFLIIGPIIGLGSLRPLVRRKI